MHLCIYSGNLPVLLYIQKTLPYFCVYAWCVKGLGAYNILSNVLVHPLMCICHMNRKVILSFLSLEYVHTMHIDNLSIYIMYVW